MRVAIASTGRFHLLDLARELDALGHEVQFYSCVPHNRAIRYGLPPECHVSLLADTAPYLACRRLLKGRGSGWWQPRLYAAINKALIRKLAPCDVLICLSGVFLEAAEYARAAFGTKIYLERGSTHIDSQVKIMAAAGKSEGPSALTIERESAGYALADHITIPSTRVAESFRGDRSLEPKLFMNAYGVDLDMFPQRSTAANGSRRVLCVGHWSFRKGADLLTEAILELPDTHLTHVGAIADTPFPRHPRFEHHAPVDQAKLTDFYARADAFVLASREEGLALVQVQALASGLPLVCTDRTGGADLRHSPCLNQRIRIVPHDDADALRNAIGETLDDAAENRFPPLTDADRQLLSWRAYGKRYEAELLAHRRL